MKYSPRVTQRQNGGVIYVAINGSKPFIVEFIAVLYVHIVRNERILYFSKRAASPDTVLFV